MSAEEPRPEEPRPEAAPLPEPPSAAGEVGEPAGAEIAGMDDLAADETPPEPVSADAPDLHMPAEPTESAPAPGDLDGPLAVSGEVPSLSAEPHEVEQAPSALTSADFGARVEMGGVDFGTSDEAPRLDAPSDPAPDAPADDYGSVPMSADDLTTTSEAPKFEAPPEPPAPAPPPAAERAAAPPPPPAAPRMSAPPARAKRGSAVPVIAAAVVVALALGGFLLARSGLLSGAPVEDAYTVAAYTPPQPLVSARERVLAYAQPSASSPVVVMFGAGAELDVQGRVSLGLGNDWYQIAWNGQTAFVRQQDAVAGGEAPPGIAERVEPEEEEEVKPGEDEKPETVAMAEFPPLPPAQFDLSSVRWIREPNARDFARFYPERALDQGRSGRVVLDCVVGGNGRLDCSVAEENPPGWGFGAAAVSIARQTRIDPTGPDGRSVAGEHLRLPLAFRASSD
jgi:TonB family protein